MTLRAALLLAVACGGSKSSGSSKADDVIAKMEEFTRELCACADLACAESVNAKYTAWGTELAKNAMPEEAKNVSPEQTKAMNNAATQYAECYTKAALAEKAKAPVPSPPVEPVPVDAPAGAQLPTDYPDEVGLETVIADARRWVEETKPGLAVVGIAASYIRSNGIIDPKYGTVTIQFDVPKYAPTADDPDRPTGAPIPESEPERKPPADGCPHVSFAKGVWKHWTSSCYRHPAVQGPRCDVADVWARAIQAGAPDNAVAVLHIGYPYQLGAWSFSIKDPVRKVNFTRTLPDNCQPTLEK